MVLDPSRPLTPSTLTAVTTNGGGGGVSSVGLDGQGWEFDGI